jgi:hypothetical protein
MAATATWRRGVASKAEIPRWSRPHHDDFMRTPESSREPSYAWAFTSAVWSMKSYRWSWSGYE